MHSSCSQGSCTQGGQAAAAVTQPQASSAPTGPALGYTTGQRPFPGTGARRRAPRHPLLPGKGPGQKVLSSEVCVIYSSKYSKLNRQINKPMTFSSSKISNYCYWHFIINSFWQHVNTASFAYSSFANLAHPGNGSGFAATGKKEQNIPIIWSKNSMVLCIDLTGKQHYCTK